MKKKMFLTILIEVFVIFSTFGFVLGDGGWHFYSDSKTGYWGKTKSFYQGTLNEIAVNSFPAVLKNFVLTEFDGYIKTTGVHSKLTKEEKFLIFCELNRWDMEKGDVYIVAIHHGHGVELAIIVSVDKKGNIENWYAYDCSH